MTPQPRERRLVDRDRIRSAAAVLHVSTDPIHRATAAWLTDIEESWERISTTEIAFAGLIARAVEEAQ